jgi:hypothetical protein
MSLPTLQYLADEHGDVTAVVVPIEVWREIESELETQHLLRSPVMRERLVAALGREGGVSLADVLDRLGVSGEEIGGG